MIVPKAISCNQHERQVTILQNVANKQVDRVFTFGEVIGPRHNKEQYMIKPFSQLLMKYLMVSIVPSLPMGRLALEKHIQWTVG